MTDPKFDMESTIPTDDVPIWARGMEWRGEDVRCVAEYGCAGGTYPQAVIWNDAIETMGEFGEEIFEYLEDTFGAVPEPASGMSWGGMAVHFVSTAVQLWASYTLDRIQSGEFDPEPTACPECDGQQPDSQEGLLRDCKRCEGTGEVYA